MSNASQDPSGAHDQQASGQDVESSQNNQQPSGNVEALEAKIRQFKGEKVKLKSQFEEALNELNSMKEERMQAEGKKDELIDAYKKRIADLEGRVNDYAYSSVSNAVKMKAQEMGCVDADAFVKHLDLSSLNVSDSFGVDNDEAKTLIETKKKEMGYFFRPVNPNVNTGIPKTNPNVEGGKPDFANMSKDELIAYGRKHGL